MAKFKDQGMHHS